MTSIIKDNTATLWRPDLYRIFFLLSLTQTPVKISTHILREEQVKEAVTLTGAITRANGLQCKFTVNKIDYPAKASFLTDPSCEYSAVLATNTPKGEQLVEYSGNARIMGRMLDSFGLPEELDIHFSLPGRMRPLRRHMRRNCAQWDGILPGLTLLSGDLTSRKQLVSLMRAYYSTNTRIIPRLINISPGGVCLHTEDAIASRLMHGNDRYLFFFFTKSPLEERIPWVFQGIKAGTFRVPKGTDKGLRIQFVKELDWQNRDGDDLCWNNVKRRGSGNLKRVLDNMVTERKDNIEPVRS